MQIFRNLLKLRILTDSMSADEKNYLILTLKLFIK